MKYLKLFIVFSFLFICNCAPKILVDSYKTDNFNLNRYKKIAIWNFSAPENTNQVSNEMADLVGLELMKMGYQIVERNQIKSIFEEHTLNMTGALFDKERKYVLELTGADAIMLGSIGQYNVQKQFLMVPIYGAGPMAVDVLNASASCTLKLVDINSGELLWSSSGSFSEEGDNPSVILKKIIKECLQDFKARK